MLKRKWTQRPFHPSLPARAKIDPALYCYRIWPRTVLTIGLFVAATWAGLVVRALFKLAILRSIDASAACDLGIPG